MNRLMKMMNNRTGGKVAPKELEKTLEGAQLYSPCSSGDATSLNHIRAQYADGTTIGTMPPPASLKQGASAFLKTVQGKDLNVLVDKLSERIAFEANGTRLYDALIAKCELAPELPPGISLEEIIHIRNEEHQHYLMLIQTVEELGGDPTVLSPCADASATATSGLCKVVADPRTTVLQALNAMLIAELTDNDAWTMLIDLCDKLNLSEVSGRFQKALIEEEEHLENVRNWLEEGISAEAGVSPSALGEKKAPNKTPAKKSSKNPATAKASTSKNKSAVSKPVKKATSKKSATQKPVKKATSKKSATQKPVKKATSKKSATKKPATKKPVKKATSKRSATQKPVKRATTKSSAGKAKTQAKKSSTKTKGRAR